MSVGPDILLVQPPYGGPYNFWKSECLALGYLASALEQRGYSVSMLDAFLLDLSIEETVRAVLEVRPRLLLGFSMLSYQLYRSGTAVLRRLRQEGLEVHATAGSWFPSFWYEAMIAEGTPLDSVVLGEGECAIVALADYLRTCRWGQAPLHLSIGKCDGVLVLRQTCQPALDELADPRRDYLSYVFDRYRLATSHTSRGCDHNRCTFCTVPAFYRGAPAHRQRSPQGVVRELEQIHARGVDFVFFTDEDFLGKRQESHERAMAIFEGAALGGLTMRYSFTCTVPGVDPKTLRRLRDLGLRAVYIGLESHSDRCLKRFGKGARAADVERAVGVISDLGLKLVPGWIMFERDTTFEEVEDAISFLERIDAYHVNYLRALYLMKDTPLEKLYGDDVYRPPFDAKYYYRDPKVDLLVRILTTDYLPEVLPYTNDIYAIWHTLLADYGELAEQQRYAAINRRMRELAFGFTREVMARIRSGCLEGMGRALCTQVNEWRRLGEDISVLAAQLGLRRDQRVAVPVR